MRFPQELVYIIDVRDYKLDKRVGLVNMSVGISSSLNTILARMNSIENGFQALNSVAYEIDLNQNHGIQETPKSDFQKILDSKMPQKEETPSVSEEENKMVEALKENLPDDIDEIKKEAINIKSKLDLKAQTTDIDSIIETFSSKYNVDEDFIKAIIKQESGFNPKATSKKGAMGLMQLMPATAKSLGVSDAYNPWENVEGGVKYLKGLLDKYNNNHELALAAYNAGSGAVKKYGGIPPYRETQNYVKSIMAAYNKIKEART